MCYRKGLPTELVRAILLWINKKQLPVDLFVAIPRRYFGASSGALAGWKRGQDMLTWLMDSGGPNTYQDMIKNHSLEYKILCVGRGA